MKQLMNNSRAKSCISTRNDYEEFEFFYFIILFNIGSSFLFLCVNNNFISTFFKKWHMDYTCSLDKEWNYTVFSL